MRVVGYIREPPGSDASESSFAQSERIRRWVARGSHALVAVCQDIPHQGRSPGRQGYLALLGIVEAGQADVVVIPGLSTLSGDKVVQEVMLWDLRSRGVAVVGTEDEELAVLADPPLETARVLIRDVLARMAEYSESLAEIEEPATVVDLTMPEVLVELLPAEDQAAS